MSRLFQSVKEIFGLIIALFVIFIFIGAVSGDWLVAVKFIILFPLLAIMVFGILYSGYIAIALVYGVIFSLFDSRYRWWK